jgi:hypothetical protein
VPFAEETRARARKAFVHRGQIPQSKGGSSVTQAWKAEHFTGGVRYRIDVEHPAIRSTLDSAGTLLPLIKAMLRIIEETVPVQRIWLDTAENKEAPRTGFVGDSSAEIIGIMEVLYDNMVKLKGMSPAFARERLLKTEPFQNYPELIAALPSCIKEE